MALGPGSWHNLFKEVDEDDSGFVTCVATRDCVASGFLLPRAPSPNTRLQSTRPPPPTHHPHCCCCCLSLSPPSLSGRYDELEVVVRKKLRVPKDELSRDDLKALWCVLDADDSDAVETEEMGIFLRGRDIGALLDETRKRKPPPAGILARPNALRRPKKSLA